MRIYLQNPLSEVEIKELLQKLDIKPLALVRQKETIWIESYKNKSLTDNEIIKVLSEHPILIERPIVIKNNKAIIGRDLEKLQKFIWKIVLLLTKIWELSLKPKRIFAL